MSSFVLVLKSFVLTIAFVIFMQISWGKKTFEERLWSWIHKSPLTSIFQEINLKILWEYASKNLSAEKLMEKIKLNRKKESYKDKLEKDKDEKPKEL